MKATRYSYVHWRDTPEQSYVGIIQDPCLESRLKRHWKNRYNPNPGKINLTTSDRKNPASVSVAEA